MTTTSERIGSAEPASITPTLKTQPLWRFMAIGLGPLAALSVFALLVALFQRLGVMSGA